MLADAQITAAAQGMMRLIPVPPVPLVQIRRKMAAPEFVAPQRARFYRIGIAVAAIAIVLCLPIVAPGLTQTIKEQVEAILHWTPPPPAPRTIDLKMQPQRVTFAEAQSRVTFRIVPPAGVPSDVASETIHVTPTAVYTKRTKAWSLGSPAVSFSYLRRGGVAFALMANRIDPREAPPSKYMFEDMDRMRNGREVILKREQFAWRNGNQIMSAVAGDGITATEIARIRSAMHGIVVPGVWPPRVGSIEKKYRIP